MFFFSFATLDFSCSSYIGAGKDIENIISTLDVEQQDEKTVQ